MNSILKGFIKAVFILTLVVSIWYVISYRSWKNRGFDDNLDLSDYFEREKYDYEEVIDDNKELAKSLYSRINYKMVEENFGEDFFDEFYGNDFIASNNFSSEFIVYLAIVNLQRDIFMTECSGTRTLAFDVVDSKIKELFGNNIKYEKVSYSNSDKSFVIEYLEESNSYKVINTRCSGIEFQKNYLETEFFKSKTITNDIVITEVVYYTSYNLKADGSYTLNFHSGLTLDSKVIYDNTLENNIDKNKFVKYNYTFVRGSNNNYYLSKIEKVK